MSSNPSTSWQKEGEKVEAVTDFIFLSFKITLGGDISNKIKSNLLLGRKTMTNLDSVLNNRDITLLIKVHIVKTMVFQQTCMDVRFGLQRKLSEEELVLSNVPLNVIKWRIKFIEYGIRPTVVHYEKRLYSSHIFNNWIFICFESKTSLKDKS